MLHEPKVFVVPAKLKALLTAFIAIGLVSFAIGYSKNPQQLWANFLLNYYFWMMLAAGGVFILAMQYISGARWFIPLRRLAESMVAYLPFCVPFFLVLLLGTHDIFEWTHHHVVEHDKVLSLKKGYLNVPFFVIRNLGFLALTGFVGWQFIKRSLAQHTGDLKKAAWNLKVSGPFILIFAWAFTFVSVDLMMSLTPHWFSTIFGVYCWAIMFLAANATITIAAILLKKAGYMGEYINAYHLHDLGKYLFGFTIFWAYIAFSQFMLIWYANLPEETSYFLTRLTPEWSKVTYFLLIGKFAIPFALLSTQYAKRNENILLVAAIWTLVVQWIDVYWLVFPAFFSTPKFGWLEIGMALGFAGLFFTCMTKFLSKVPVVPNKDPLFEAGVHHHF